MHQSCDQSVVGLYTQSAFWLSNEVTLTFGSRIIGLIRVTRLDHEVHVLHYSTLLKFTKMMIMYTNSWDLHMWGLMTLPLESFPNLVHTLDWFYEHECKRYWNWGYSALCQHFREESKWLLIFQVKPFSLLESKRLPNEWYSGKL